MNTNSDTCAAQGCCWDALPPNTAGPYCYKAPPPKCPNHVIPAALRVDCGDAMTSNTACLDKGCCWSALPPGVAGPYCYTDTPKAATCPNTAAADRVDCGTTGTNAQTCVANTKCCWTPLPAGTNGPWCYYSPEYVPAPVQPAQCPKDPYPAFARVDCGPNNTPTTCGQKGCCWNPLPADTPGPWCYQTSLAAGAGTPGSDPGITAPATTANPGGYSAMGYSPVVPIAVALVPETNKIVLLEREAGGKTGTTHTYTMNVATMEFEPLHLTTDIFCVGGSMLPEGRVIAVGGGTGAASLQGVRVYTKGGDWQQNAAAAQLQVPRWYPTAMLLPNGKVWVFSGATDIQPPGVVQPSAELVPRGNTNLVNLPILAQTPQNLYPHTIVVPADTNRAQASIFIMAGRRSQLLNLDTLATLVELPQAPVGGRVYPLSGGAVMLPLIPDVTNNYPPAEIVICGGGTGNAQDAPALKTCIRGTPSAGAQLTWLVEEMPLPRLFAEMVALPDRTYLIINGASKGSSGFAMASSSPVRTALLYNPSKPVGQRFTTLATSTLARLYHSEAILVPDGRVVVLGSTPNYDGNIVSGPYGPIHPNEHMVEAYSPPYLSNGMVRPVIQSFTKNLQGQWDYNAFYTITATIPTGVAANVQVTLIAPGFVTHATHMGERTIGLYIHNITLINNTTATILVQAPRSSDVAQPQQYMLWVVDNGTPSVASWIQVGGVPAAVAAANWPKF
ncbi:hypothetical protein HK104_010070 [Borealophlyctis nickersoniae]|nr:hypothetical protein HK104_010070 [Borealophlyctis nickersoniae]